MSQILRGAEHYGNMRPFWTKHKEMSLDDKQFQGHNEKTSRIQG